MRKHRVKQCLAILLTLMLSIGVLGCGTTEDVPAKADKKQPTKTEYLDVETAKDEEVDYSKYEDEEIEVVEEKDSNVKLSDGQASGKDQFQTDPVPEGQQLPVEPGQVAIDKSQQKTCYLTIACKTILNNMGDLTPGKEGLVPADGILYSRRAVTFYEGESVFDVLQRETRNNRIHMESSFTPMYNSAYVEGIGNLYEFDCGPNSGWMYCVNGWYPNYGVSRYVVQQNDEIQFNYTCDLGRDL